MPAAGDHKIDYPAEDGVGLGETQGGGYGHRQEIGRNVQDYGSDDQRPGARQAGRFARVQLGPATRAMRLPGA